jgi:secreted Zn-dependent insulinase-like peptidase
MYNAKAIKDYGKYFVINNSIIMLGDRQFKYKLVSNYKSFLTNFNPHSIFDKREPWYNVPYSTYRFTTAFMNQITNDNTHPEKLGFTKNFIFLKGYRLPGTVHLVRQCPKSLIRECLLEYRKDRFDLTPVILQKNNMHSLYFKRDRSYLVSKLNFFNKFIFPETIISTSNQALFKLFVVGFTHHFKNFFYSQSIKHNLIKVRMKAK